MTTMKNIQIAGLSSGVLIGGNFQDIEIDGCENLMIYNNTIQDSPKSGIRLTNCKNITIVGNKIINVMSGIYAENCTGIIVMGNYMKNMQGPKPQAQFVQFNNVSGPGNKIVNNYFENIFGQSNPEDAINIFMSNGTQDSPILVSANMIKGGGPSPSGGGIMLGDTGGSWQVAQNNYLVNPGQYGIAVAGGNNISVVNNRIYSKQQVFTNVGMYAWAQNKVQCSALTFSGNKINWTSNNGNINNWWNGGNCGTITGDIFTFDATLNESLIPANPI